MSNVSQFSTTASSNNSAPPNGAPENMAPSTVNDTMRENMAALARWYQDTQGSLVSSGSSNAYTLATNSSHAALADQSMLAFRADRANTGAATLAVDGLAAKSLVRADGAALVSGDIQANALVLVAYNSNQDKYFLLSQSQPRSASETVSGVAEIATQAETDAGTDDTTIVTPKKLENRLIFTDEFESSEQSVTANTIVSASHSLSAVPKLAMAVLRCKTAELGYSVGDEVTGWVINDGSGQTVTAGPPTVYANASDVKLVLGDQPPEVIKVSAGSDADYDQITRANWRIVLRAFN